MRPTNQKAIDQAYEIWLADATKWFPVAFGPGGTGLNDPTLTQEDHFHLVGWLMTLEEKQDRLLAASERVAFIDWGAHANRLTPYLMAHMRSYPERLKELDPHVLEQLVGEYFASQGLKVKHLGRDPTTSADLMAIETSPVTGADIRYLIEVKRTKERVGIEVVKTVLGALHLEQENRGWHIGLIVSLSGFKDFRGTNRNQLRMKGIELQDGSDVARYLRTYKPRSDGGLWLPADWDEHLPRG
jgi:hypothetical protein